jgi:hypothetical protein
VHLSYCQHRVQLEHYKIQFQCWHLVPLQRLSQQPYFLETAKVQAKQAVITDLYSLLLKPRLVFVEGWHPRRQHSRQRLPQHYQQPLAQQEEQQQLQVLPQHLQLQSPRLPLQQGSHQPPLPVLELALQLVLHWQQPQ